MRDLVFVIDPVGNAFDALRSSTADVALFRCEALSAPASEARLVVVAVPAVPWSDIAVIASMHPTLVLAAAGSESEASRALEAGAIGYIDQHVAPTSMRRALEAALTGEVVYSRRVLANAIRGNTGARLRSWPHLTRRQRQVLSLIAQGATDKEIGVALGIAPSTAQKHASNLVRRLGVPNRAAAVATASS